jgi:hypothetical protein
MRNQGSSGAVRLALALVLMVALACGGGQGREDQPMPPDASAQSDGGTQADAGAESEGGIQLPEDGGTVSFASHVAPIFNATCTGYCHPGGYSPMTLREDEALSVLVDVAAVGCTSGARLRVKPGDADPKSSYLMAKLLGQELCSGGVMPPGGGLPAEQVEIVRAWIEGGAQP